MADQDRRRAGDPEADDRAEVGGQLDALRRLARSLRLDEVRDGTWFSRLLQHSLEGYVAEVDADYLRRTYPGRSAEDVVAARVEQAARQAGVEGALSAGAYTTAVAATLGSGGGASPLTLPAAAVSFVVDLLYVSSVQLRLAHDIAVLHRVPLHLDDPEDLWKLIGIAFGAKSAEAGRGALGKGVPVLLRPVLQRLSGAGVAVAGRSLPLVGKALLQRSLVKFSLPAVGVPLSAAVNSWSVRTAGTAAARAFRREGRIVAAAQEMAERTNHPAQLLWVLWTVSKADGLVHEHERRLLRQVTGVLGSLEAELAALAELQTTADPHRPAEWSLLAAAEGDRTGLYEAAVVAASVDGKVNVNELTVLRRLAGHCGTRYDEAAVRALAAEFART